MIDVEANEQPAPFGIGPNRGEEMAVGDAHPLRDVGHPWPAGDELPSCSVRAASSRAASTSSFVRK